jgi:ribosomal protein L10
MKALEQAGYETIALDELEGSVVVLYANGDEYAPLKVVNKYAKQFASDKTTKTTFKFWEHGMTTYRNYKSYRGYIITFQRKSIIRFL